MPINKRSSRKRRERTTSVKDTHIDEHLLVTCKLQALMELQLYAQLGQIPKKSHEENKTDREVFIRAFNENCIADQLLLGVCLRFGIGVECCPKEAVKHFQYASELYHENTVDNKYLKSQALNMLADCYEKGDGVNSNVENAIKKYIEAGRVYNNAWSLYKIGERYINDNSFVQVDNEKKPKNEIARNCLNKAIKKGSPAAQGLLAAINSKCVQKALPARLLQQADREKAIYKGAQIEQAWQDIYNGLREQFDQQIKNNQPWQNVYNKLQNEFGQQIKSQQQTEGNDANIINDAQKPQTVLYMFKRQKTGQGIKNTTDKKLTIHVENPKPQEPAKRVFSAA